MRSQYFVSKIIGILRKKDILRCEQKLVYFYLKMTTTCPELVAVWGPESVASLKDIIPNDVSLAQKDGDYGFIG